MMELEAAPAPIASSSTSPPASSAAQPTNTFHISTACIPPAPNFSVPLMQKCTRCTYTGPIDCFPPRRTGGGHLKVCTACMDKQNARKVASELVADGSGRSQIATAAMSFDDFLKLVTLNKSRPFDFDTMVSVPPGMFVAGEHLYNRSNRIRDFLAEASDYHWNQKKTKRGGKSTVVTYFCAQLEGEQSKSRTQDADRRSRSRITRYHCGGWLRITIMDDNEHLLRIRMTHAEAHPSFPASFRRPPQTSEFKLDTSTNPSPIFTNMQVTQVVGDVVAPVVPLVPPSLPHVEDHPSGEEQVSGESTLQADISSGTSAPVVYFSPDQLDGLKRKFEAMMVAATGPVSPDLAHALGAVFDHIERTATDVDMGRLSKRQRIS